jgi:hypothetical protein
LGLGDQFTSNFMTQPCLSVKLSWIAVGKGFNGIELMSL